MALLDSINEPADLRGLSPEQLADLAGQIRQFLIDHVSRTGGHLGPNLGVVELTLGLHRVFESPRDPIIFDVGHQAYVHKILTGRQSGFDQLRQQDGLSGYPSRAESEHDWVENSHASTALSYAEGMAKALRLTHPDDTERRVVAVVGDGALTGGMAWEALNNIAADPALPIVIVVNDNGRSYTPTVGGLANYLNDLRTNPRYEPVLDLVRRNVSRAPLVGPAAYELLHGIKSGLKDILAPQGLFSDLGLKYVGPIDGHDQAGVERALQQAKQYGGPVLVHCMTHKGQGFQAALDNVEDQFHSVGKIDAVTGEPLQASTTQNWTATFSRELVRIGRERPEVVAVTAAMLHPTGLAAFAQEHPERTFDVGIAEQHAATSSAGLAMAGLHPVVAIYSTFLNRAYDQLLMDVALHGLGVTFVLDRAGITGPDGSSHHGMWDGSILQTVPGLHLAQPRDAARLASALDEAVAISDAPSVIRFSRDSPPADDIDPIRTVNGIDVLSESGDAQVLLVGHGAMVETALAAAELLRAQGIGVRVVDPVWSLPFNPALVDLAADHAYVVTIEDSGVVGGCGARLTQELAQAGHTTAIHNVGIPQRFQPHGSRGEVLAACGLTAQDIARRVAESVSTDVLVDAWQEPASYLDA
ncbi:MAG TPA: 1-deoxy-D-xylulose-5-phosphate synthase [Candidatus Avipropionibacterium avicola]|uniref:1-deoxy-D-xylulose-5-phosphate synthase n=1 Tax=Candidatus Avipropionibacterium avicola TaxID=2840701 RepID=A0A9D1KMQ8_9ACTN|nr:1-deoxy-D-xylulose-5-phosphate synthase [Candidatus Avipropionibacterium avicola]